MCIKSCSTELEVSLSIRQRSMVYVQWPMANGHWPEPRLDVSGLGRGHCWQHQIVRSRTCFELTISRNKKDAALSVKCIIICHLSNSYSICMGQIIKSVCVCQSVCVSVCGHYHGRISWSIFTKICTEITTLKVKTSFFGSILHQPFPILPQIPILGEEVLKIQANIK